MAATMGKQRKIAIVQVFCGRNPRVLFEQLRLRRVFRKKARSGAWPAPGQRSRIML